MRRTLWWALLLLILGNLALFAWWGGKTGAPPPHSVTQSTEDPALQEAASLIDRGSLVEASRRIDAALRAHPDEPGWTVLKARVMSIRGWAREAIAMMAPVVKRHPESRELLDMYNHLRLFVDPMALVAENARVAPINEARLSSALSNSDRKRMLSQLPAIEKDLLLSLDQAPTNDTRYNLAVLYVARGDIGRAREQLDTAFAQGVEPGYRGVDARITLAYVALCQDDREVAREQLEAALAYMMGKPEMDFTLALGYPEQLMIYLMVYFDKMPDDRDIQLLHERYRQLAAQGFRSPTPAEIELDRLERLAAALRAHSPEAVLAAFEKRPDALKKEEEVPCIFSRTVHAALLEHHDAILRGDACRQLGRLEEAAEWYQDAVDRMPESRWTRDRLVSIRGGSDPDVAER